jgi:hypothetical protein
MDLLAHLPEWIESKAKIFAAERYVVVASHILGDEKKARYIELDGNGLFARATLWDDGALELEALDEDSKTVIQASRVVNTVAELYDNLNWWLSEVAIYVAPQA